MTKSVFDFSDYKRYLTHMLQGRGQRAQLAKHVACQTAYLSQVLNDEAHFSLEQAFATNEFLGHDRQEGEYFLLLVQRQRAGSPGLRAHFETQRQSILQRRSQIKNRVDSNDRVSAEHQSQYYSSWIYAAIHVAISIPELQNKAALAEYFALPQHLIIEALEFLTDAGLAEAEGDQLKVGKSHIHLADDSHHIQKHHTNWRLQGMTSLDRKLPTDLHYSVVLSLSKADAATIRERFMKLIQENLKLVQPSKEEVLYSTVLDFFTVK